MKFLSKQTILENLIKQASVQEIDTEDKLHILKKRFSREYKIPLPKNITLQETYKIMLENGWNGDKNLQKLLRKRKIRTLSGVSVITVLTKPYPCPGRCVYCPSEPGMPKSYLSNEPGAMRAVLDNFSATDQVKTRLKSLAMQGHEIDKIEMIVLGGTFSFYEKKYKNEFIKELFDACNGVKSKSLSNAQEINETANSRIIGLSLETRPDHINEEEVKYFRKLGSTKVQLGVQHTNDKILEKIQRGEKRSDTVKAIQLLKDAGFKIATHLMPNLPGSTPELDIEMINEFFENQDFKPDHIKLYPCVVTPYSELENWFKKGEFKTYSDETLMKILIEMKKIVPKYVRIERLLRDIPGESIIDGSKKTNFRQILHSKSVKCRCIRCREIKDNNFEPKNVEFNLMEYDASNGKEFFLSYEDNTNNKLLSLLRLRFHSYSFSGEPHFIPELNNASIIREVHTYGAQIKIGEGDSNKSQHSGLGRKLIEKAEDISKKAGYKRIAVISGIGTRNYYRKWGYKLEGTYMIKEI